MQAYRDSIQQPLPEVESDRLANRVGSGRKDNIAGLNEADDEISGPCSDLLTTQPQFSIDSAHVLNDELSAKAV